MEVFGLKSQSLRYNMDGFGSVHMYLTRRQDYFSFAHPSSQHLMAAAAMGTTSATSLLSLSAPSPPPQPSLSSQSKRTLVVGASQGIGRELVKQLSQRQPNGQVIGSSRFPVVDFGDGSSSNVRRVLLDPSSAESVREAARGVPAVDTLIINVTATTEEREVEKLLPETPDKHMACGADSGVTEDEALCIARAFLHVLKARKTRQIVLVSMTTTSDSEVNHAGGGGGGGSKGSYDLSEAALNRAARQLHNELHEWDGFTVVPIHAASKAEDMGRISGEGGVPGPSKSAARILSIVAKLTPQDSGQAFSF